MSKLTDALRARKIYNLYDLLETGEPCISYQAGSNERFAHGAVWHIWIKNHKIAGGAWYEHGGKDFVVMGLHDRELILGKAFAYLATIRPKMTFVKGPWKMTWIPESAADRMKKILASPVKDTL